MSVVEKYRQLTRLSLLWNMQTNPRQQYLRAYAKILPPLGAINLKEIAAGAAFFKIDFYSSAGVLQYLDLVSCNSFHPTGLFFRLKIHLSFFFPSKSFQIFFFQSRFRKVRDT